MQRKYPIGIQNFRKIREGGFLYVDKTEAIHRLVTTGDYYFLSRPRRFGKSLLVDTIEELFKGSRELFEGLWIHDKWDWSKTHPVIHFNFADIGIRTLGLKPAIHRGLAENANRLGVQLSETSYDQQFKELIEKAAVQSRVVILIDEYDKPLIDHLEDSEQVEANRSVMKSLYSILKGQDEHIRFLLLTGVSRFSKVSIFSDLNNLRDITLSPQFDDLVGITQQELEHYFAPEIASLQAEEPDILPKIKEWYNGYTWGETVRLYNPFSLLNFMADRRFSNFWIATGTPSFLIKAIRENPDRYIFSEQEILVGSEGVEDLFADAINPVTLMFQTGFLTIKAHDHENDLYTLVYPNKEVERSVLTHLTAAYSFGDTAFVQPTVTGLKTALVKNDIPKVIQIIDALFSNIPNPLWRGHTEAFFHGLIHNTFQLVGIGMDSETYNAVGRMDAVVKTSTHIYVLEFKLDRSAAEALGQVFDREYLKPFQLDRRAKVAVGINFSSRDRKVADYEISIQD